MNNIDILEERIKIIESLCTDDCINKETVIKPLKYAISNLIAENKKLKEKNKQLTDEYMIQKHLINAEFLDDYIPKSKVQGLIDEINKAYEDSKDEYGESEYYYPDYTIEKLQSLLGKE